LLFVRYNPNSISYRTLLKASLLSLRCYCGPRLHIFGQVIWSKPFYIWYW